MHMYKNLCMDDSRHLNKTTSVSTPMHMYKNLCMDDSRHLSKTTSVSTSMHRYKSLCMDDSRHLNKTTSVSAPMHMYKSLCMGETRHLNKTSISIPTHAQDDLRHSDETTSTTVINACIQTKQTVTPTNGSRQRHSDRRP
jgi:hypothetical protein